MRPLADQKITLEKYPGKGGWTYALIRGLKGAGNKPFGWQKVKGNIDGHEIKGYKLMPMGDDLFLPVKAEIRKQINKHAGDSVHIILYPDDAALEVPEELMTCLEDAPAALSFFNSISESERKYYITWIYGAKKEETKTARIATTINRLAHGLKMHDKVQEK